MNPHKKTKLITALKTVLKFISTVIAIIILFCLIQFNDSNLITKKETFIAISYHGDHKYTIITLKENELINHSVPNFPSLKPKIFIDVAPNDSMWYEYNYTFGPWIGLIHNENAYINLLDHLIVSNYNCQFLSEGYG